MTPELLVAATGCLLRDAERIAKPLGDVMAQYAITTPKRRAAFLAQTAHESRRYQRFVEDLDYRRPERIVDVFGARVVAAACVPRWPDEDAAAWRTRLRATRIEIACQYVGRPEALANLVYADRLGNGNEWSGDGWRFRGRGAIQLTGRAAYEAFGADIGEPIAVHPDLLAEPAYAALSAGWYWQRNQLNRLADAGRFDLVTRRINGPAMAGHDDRVRLYNRAYAALTLELKNA